MYDTIGGSRNAKYHLNCVKYLASDRIPKCRISKVTLRPKIGSRQSQIIIFM